MKRIYSEYAYSSEPRAGCWWNETHTPPVWPEAHEQQTVDVAIIGGGFTGISAALHLAQAGVSVAVLEAKTPGWGASGRNGGFCCLGGSKLSSGAMTRKYGKRETDIYEAGEVEATQLAARLIAAHKIDADTHSKGETLLAHKPGVMRKIRAEAREMERAGLDPQLVEKDDLRSHGLNGMFHGAITRPEGFALNPLKYFSGLSRAAQKAGARLYQNSPCLKLSNSGSVWQLSTPKAKLTASNVIVATNGYSSDDIPEWLAGRYMPTQSTIMVTRPMSESELNAQGWTSDQMAYDTRHMLHYFRLMPDRRFLFGARGGLRSSPASEQAIRKKVRRDFEQLFPAWSKIETTHAWSGMVCLSRNLVPFIGPVPGQPGLFAGLCYHGNGVATGTYAGRVLSDLIQGGRTDLPYSEMLKSAGRFPFGTARRLVMPFAYAALSLLD